MLFSAVNHQGIPMWRLILDGKKTQTRRSIEGVNLYVDKFGVPGATDCELTGNPILIVTTEKGRVRFEVGKSYAVQPKRGQPTIWFDEIPDMVLGIRRVAVAPPINDQERKKYHPARITPTRIWLEDVRRISQTDAVAEGFDSPLYYLTAWTAMHDRRAYRDLPVNKTVNWNYALMQWGAFLEDRPAKFYQCWALEFPPLGGSNATTMD